MIHTLIFSLRYRTNIFCHTYAVQCHHASWGKNALMPIKMITILCVRVLGTGQWPLGSERKRRSNEWRMKMMHNNNWKLFNCTHRAHTHEDYAIHHRASCAVNGMKRGTKRNAADGTCYNHFIPIFTFLTIHKVWQYNLLVNPKCENKMTSNDWLLRLAQLHENRREIEKKCVRDAQRTARYRRSTSFTHVYYIRISNTYEHVKVEKLFGAVLVIVIITRTRPQRKWHAIAGGIHLNVCCFIVVRIDE